MYIQLDTPLPYFIPLPRFMLDSRYTLGAKLLYGLLLNRTNLSRKSGWVSQEGYVYVIYPIHQMAQDLGRSQRTINTILNELESGGLLTRLRQGRNRPNQIFLRLPEEALAAASRTRKKSAPEAQPAASPETQYLPPNKKEKNQKRENYIYHRSHPEKAKDDFDDEGAYL